MTELSFPAVQEGDLFMCRGNSMFSDMTFGMVYQVDEVSEDSIHWMDNIGDHRAISTSLFHEEFILGGFEVGDTVTCIKKPAEYDFSYRDTHVDHDYKIRTIKDDVGNGYIEWVDSVSDFPEDTVAGFIKNFKLVARLGVPVVPADSITYAASRARVKTEVRPTDISLSLITLALQSRGIELTAAQAESLMDVITVYANGLTK